MDINNITECKKSIQMKLPICNFDVKTVLVENARVIFPTKSLSIRVGFGTMCGTKNKGDNIWKMNTWISN